VGHSLENDLRALRLSHARCVDTVCFTALLRARIASMLVGESSCRKQVALYPHIHAAKGARSALRLGFIHLNCVDNVLFVAAVVDPLAPCSCDDEDCRCGGRKR
jgi:hypothetical protein